MTLNNEVEKKICACQTKVKNIAILEHQNILYSVTVL